MFLKSHKDNTFSYVFVIMCYIHAGRVNNVEKVYTRMSLKWQFLFCSNTYMGGYLKNGKLDESVRIGGEECVFVELSGWWLLQIRGNQESKELFDAILDRNQMWLFGLESLMVIRKPCLLKTVFVIFANEMWKWDKTFFKHNDCSI